MQKTVFEEIRHEMMVDKQTEFAQLLGTAPNQYNRYEKQSGQPMGLKFRHKAYIA